LQKINGYGIGLTLDRVNNDGNYEPSNCRWVNRYVQGSNKRNNIKYKGETASEAARKLGLNSKTVLSADEQIRVLEATKDLELRNEIAEGLIGDIRTKGNSADSRMNSIKQAQILLPERRTLRKQEIGAGQQEPSSCQRR